MKQREMDKRWAELQERQRYLQDKAMAMPSVFTTGEMQEVIFMHTNIDEPWQRYRCLKKADEMTEECKKSKLLKDKFWLFLNPSTSLLSYTSKRVVTAVKVDIIKDYEQLMEGLKDLKVDAIDKLLADVADQRQADQDKVEKCIQHIKAGTSKPIKIGRPLSYK